VVYTVPVTESEMVWPKTLLGRTKNVTNSAKTITFKFMLQNYQTEVV